MKILPMLLGTLFAAASVGAAEGPKSPVLEPVYRWTNTDGSERFTVQGELSPGQRHLTNEPPAFLAVPPGEVWPGLVPLFGLERPDRFELRRRALRGQENFTEPLFFALPPEDETVAPRIAGRWEVTATRGDAQDAWFQWELTAEGDNVHGRFDPSADYRVASVSGGSLRTNRFELLIEYNQNQYALTGDWLDGKLRGSWRETSDAEQGRWEARRAPSPSPTAPSGEVVPLHEWQRGGERRYGIAAPGVGWTNAARPLARVWKPAGKSKARP